MEIVLFQPQIPQNTGNILRTCAVTGSKLSLIEPISFDISDKQLRRAGLDYAKDVPLKTYSNWEEYLDKREDLPLFFFSSKAEKNYTEARYPENSSIVFGSETSGLPLELHELHSNHFYKIPMLKNYRCLNLSSSAAVVLYEALRQQEFSSILF